MIYASIGRHGMHDDNKNKDDGTTVVSTGQTSKKGAYKSKLARLQAVTKTGTPYFKAVSLWFAVENRQAALGPCNRKEDETCRIAVCCNLVRGSCLKIFIHQELME
jgi:hypothetical protein